MLSGLLRQLFQRPRSAHAPVAAERHLEQGRACLDTGRTAEAKLHLRAALELEPESQDVLERLGLALGLAGELDLAKQAATRALELDPRSVAARLCLGNVYAREERYDDAIREYRDGLAIEPDNGFVHYNLGIALLNRGDTREALAQYRRTVEIFPDRPEEYGSILFLLNACAGVSNEEIAAEHRRWGERFADPLARSTPHRNSADPDRRLQIGYVSGDFFGHAASSFIEPVLAHHDRERFEVVCFVNAAESSQEVVKHAGRWYRIAELPDEDAARFIEEQGIDILVDLSGHTRRNRLPAFARKPAPVQMSMLGYPNTTGMAAMDYRITDVHGDPPGRTEHLYRERLLRLPRSLWCYAPFESMPPVSAPPSASRGCVTLASLNAAYKLNEGTLDAWIDILRAAPDARMLLATIPRGDAQSRLRAHFAARGIDAGRIDVVDRMNVVDYWRLLEGVDLALDSFPCNGGSTTCESLWMGVPTLTLAGAAFRERAGLSLLTNVGLPEFITYSVDEYVAAATELARDPGRLAAVRIGLRERMRASPLTDAAGHTRELEALYRSAWKTWCEERGEIR